MKPQRLPGVLATKRRMRAYAREHELTVPRSFAMLVPRWGRWAETLAWRATRHARDRHGWRGRPTASRTLALADVLWPGRVFTPPITHRSWRWARPLGRRIGGPALIVWHHAAAAVAGPDEIDSWHRARGYSGIGYHYLVRLNGEVCAGRPEWAYGAHTVDANGSLGVCCEGNYEVRREMPLEQLLAASGLARLLASRYGSLHRRHRSVPGNRTACPGRHFPFETITG